MFLCKANKIGTTTSVQGYYIEQTRSDYRGSCLEHFLYNPHTKEQVEVDPSTLEVWVCQAWWNYTVIERVLTAYRALQSSINI